MAAKLKKGDTVRWNPSAWIAYEKVERPDGTIDRAALGQSVFENSEEREALNAILHPPVLEAMRTWVEATVASGQDAVGIVPLLFEVGATDPWDAVCCVVSDEEVVLQRLAQRGLSRNEGLSRMAA